MALALLTASTAGAVNELESIPGPTDTGGMVMPMVSLDLVNQSVSVGMEQGNHVNMYPLQQYEVLGDYPYADAVFNPDLSAEPWYDLLDPTRQHLPFSTRFGFMIASANAELIPADSFVYIKATDITEGLKIYDLGHHSDDHGAEPGLSMWQQVFGEGNYGGEISPELDNLVAWGDSTSIKMWHPVVLVPSPGIYSARFEIYLGDDYGQALEGWSSANITLNWTAVAVPEPATAALLAAATGAAFALLRRKQKRTARKTP